MEQANIVPPIIWAALYVYLIKTKGYYKKQLNHCRNKSGVPTFTVKKTIPESLPRLCVWHMEVKMDEQQSQ